MRFPNDTGPIYLETVQGRFPVEPFNTISNLIFLLILIFWALKVYKNPNDQQFLALVLPILLIGFIGGTMYHATRSAEIWLLLDWVPIMILCMALVVYLIFRIVDLWWQRMLFISVVFGLSFVLRIADIPNGLQITIGYVITVLTILVPLIWYLIKTKWKNFKYVALALVIFGVAIFFRSIDLKQATLTMGTHWLWHFFGGISVHFLIAYIFRDKSLNLSAQKA